MKKTQVLIIAFLITLSIFAFASMQAVKAAPSISLSPTSGHVGSAVTVSGSGFAHSSTITIKFDGTTQSTSPSTVTTSNPGSIPSAVTFTVPASVAGSQTISATDASGNTASASFTVTPAISLTPTSGIVGSTLTVTGTGLLGSHSVTATFNGGSVPLSPSTTTPAGGLSATFTVPASSSGSKTVLVSDGTNSPTASFTVSPAISLNPTNGAVGSTVTVSGSGFAASSAITIKFDGVTRATSPAKLTTNTSGSFSNVTFTVPTSNGGSNTVSATDASSNTGSVTFTVNQATPTVSAPSLSPSGSTTAGTSVSLSATVSGGGATPTGSATFQVEIGSGNWSTIGSAVSLRGGSASTTCVLLTAGSYQFQVVYSGDNNYTGAISNPALLTVNPASLDHFVFNTVGTQNTGSAFNIMVTAVDAYGNTFTNYTGTPSLTVSAGSITPSSMDAFAGGVGSTSVTVTAAGSNVTITTTDGNYTVTSNSFTVIPTISASAGAGGYINPNGAVSVSYGDNQTFIITANTGYYIVDVSVNGSPVGPVSTYTFINIQTANTISATFAPTTTPSPSPTATPTPAPTATPTPTPSHTSTPSATAVPATTNSGTTVDLAISGNITRSQISNAIIMSYQPTATTTVSFTIRGPDGTAGLGNMTIPKTAIPYGKNPVVYIDSQKAPNQGYTQDTNNFYVWYTTHFGTNLADIGSQVTVRFAVTSTSPALSLGLVLFVVTTVTEITLIFTVVAVKRLRQKSYNA